MNLFTKGKHTNLENKLMITRGSGGRVEGEEGDRLGV